MPIFIHWIKIKTNLDASWPGGELLEDASHNSKQSTFNPGKGRTNSNIHFGSRMATIQTVSSFYTRDGHGKVETHN